MIIPYLHSHSENQIILQEILNCFQMPYILFDTNKQVESMLLSDSLSYQFDLNNEEFQSFLEQIMLTKRTLKETLIFYKNNKHILQGHPVLHGGEILGVLVIFQSPSCDTDSLEEYRNMATDLQVIFESSYDVIFVADKQGIALRVSSACERLWGIKQEDFIGRNTFDLEKEGVFRPSITRLVLEQKKKVSVIQKTGKGRTLLVVGTPVMDKHGEIVRVINASKDITEIDELQRELRETKDILERYRSQIEHLMPKKVTHVKKMIYQSKPMKDLVEQIKNIAQFDSTVLITGESGVGKEIVASLIYESSKRVGKPFIKINCSAIPSSLLESELFGYEKGTFTGASKEGKNGLLYAANTGTVFLDEISDLPLELQVKLLRFLQEGEIQRIGSIKPTYVDVRVITAANKSLLHLVEKGLFREDLYYRLNVIPLYIPSLKERKEDIPLLVDYFTKTFNQKYGMQKMMSADTIQEIVRHEWKGNVRELQNFVERLLIITQGNEMIEAQEVKKLITSSSKELAPFRFHVYEDVDLMGTLEKIEKQILEYGVSKYKTTIEIAEALKVNQSTISKKLKKHHISIKDKRL